MKGQRFLPHVRPRGSAAASNGGARSSPTAPTPGEADRLIDLTRRRDQLNARVAELQWDLGGLVYEMAIRDRIRIDVLVKRVGAAPGADAELGEVERILRIEQTGAAGACAHLRRAPQQRARSTAGSAEPPLMEQVPSASIGAT